MINEIHIPFINPIKFYDVTRVPLAKFFTKHFDDYMFGERLYYWQQRESYKRFWQTTDIIYLQFESAFDPIVITILNKKGIPAVPAQPALVGLQNEFDPTLYSFQVGVSLAGLDTGCYRVQLECGSGVSKRKYFSDWQYVSSTQLKNTLLLQYWHDSYHEDVIFETGIKFEMRIPGSIGFLDPIRANESYRDQKNNPTLLSSRTGRQWPVYFGDQFGLTDDDIDLLNRIWSCNHVLIDNKEFTAADGAKFEFIPVDRYPKRGVKLVVEEGINRNSQVFTQTVDPTKKLITTVIVEAKVFGDTGNQGSLNTVPVTNIE